MSGMTGGVILNNVMPGSAPVLFQNLIRSGG